MDTNVDNYSIEDLLQVLNITDSSPNQNDITETAEKLILRLNNERKKDLAIFVEKARDKIIDSMGGYDEEEAYEDDTDYEGVDIVDTDIIAQQKDLWENEYPEQTDEVERTKPTDRKQKIQIFDEAGIQNNAFVMNRERLGVLQSHPIPVVQGTINPNLKNLITRIISVDSQYRANIIPYKESGFNNINSPAFNTNFSFDLSEKISNVISMKLHSIQIPTSWYIFDDSLGNTCFIYQTLDANGKVVKNIFVKIPPGNYTLNFLNTYFTTYSYYDPATNTVVPAPLDLVISLQETTGKIAFISSVSNIKLIFYSDGYNNTLLFNSCLDGSCGTSQMRLNQNFGWYLGYRTVLENELTVLINYSSINPPFPPSNQLPIPYTSATYIGGFYYNVAQSPANLYGPTYFLLVVDDYNNNRVNNSLVTITNVSNKLDLPSYYNTGIKNANNTFATVGCTDIIDKAQPDIKVPRSTLPYVIHSSPRQLTQSQIYTANEILYNRTTYSNLTFGPSTADVLALIPLTGIANLREKLFYTTDATGKTVFNPDLSQASQPYILLGPQLQDNGRTYFGPVNIERMNVRLLDDKGNLVNLHDVDWSFSLIIEQLYQY